MRLSFAAKTIFVCFLLLITLNCRNQPVSDSSNKTNSPATNSNSANQANAEIPEPQSINFESAEKVEIVGTFYASPKANSSAVLLLHQWGSDRHSYDGFARRLQADGFGVLTIDGRGFGDSTKTTDGKTVAAERTYEAVKGMLTDVGNAFDFLAKQKNVDASRIGIVGASYGSSLAIIYAGAYPKVKAVALLSPGLNYFGNMPTDPAIKDYGDRPLLLVAAEDDKDSADTIRKLMSELGNANDAKLPQVKIYPKGGHGTALFEVGLQDTLEEFLTKSLQK